MKATAAATTSRKLPSQPRARVTVDCILQAAESIIASRGYEAATTNLIAEVAGVSIGTVYQYFPRKEAIVAALLENAVINVSGPIRQFLLSNMHTPLRECMPEVLRLILVARRTRAAIFQGLPRDLTRFGDDAPPLTPETFLCTTTRAFFQEHRGEIRVEDLEVAMNVIEYLVVGAVDTYLNESPPKMGETVFLDNLAAATLKYLAS